MTFFFFSFLGEIYFFHLRCPTYGVWLWQLEWTHTVTHRVTKKSVCVNFQKRKYVNREEPALFGDRNPTNKCIRNGGNFESVMCSQNFLFKLQQWMLKSVSKNMVRNRMFAYSLSGSPQCSSEQREK